MSYGHFSLVPDIRLQFIRRSTPRLLKRPVGGQLAPDALLPGLCIFWVWCCLLRSLGPSVARIKIGSIGFLRVSQGPFWDPPAAYFSSPNGVPKRGPHRRPLFRLGCPRLPKRGCRTGPFCGPAPGPGSNEKYQHSRVWRCSRGSGQGRYGGPF